MTAYTAPTRDMQFVINELAGMAEVAALPAFAEQEAGPELVEAVLEEAAKLAAEVLAPLNHSGDVQGVKIGPKGVIPADGFAKAYRKFVEGGWNGIGCPGRARRPGLAGDDQHRHPGNVELGQHVLRAVPAAERRRDRSHQPRRLRSSSRRCTCRKWSAANGPAP